MANSVAVAVGVDVDVDDDDGGDELIVRPNVVESVLSNCCVMLWMSPSRSIMNTSDGADDADDNGAVDGDGVGNRDKDHEELVLMAGASIAYVFVRL